MFFFFLFVLVLIFVLYLKIDGLFFFKKNLVVDLFDE